MAQLPHYRFDQNNRDHGKIPGSHFEPVQGNLFEVTIICPEGVEGGDLLLQQVKSIGGLENIYRDIAPVQQKYKFSSRSYAGMPDDTTLDLAVQFELNLNDSNEAYTFNTLSDWYKLIYNPETGEMGLKKDYIGQMIVTQYNRTGDVFRTLTLYDVFIASGIPFAGTLDYSSPEPLVLDVTFKCDYFKEEKNG